MRDRWRVWLTYLVLLLVGLGFRFFVALRLPNDAPDDGRVYAQIARNVLEQHVYSHDNEPPYVPSLIRLPGYPLFLAAVYSVFGHGNNTAVRVAQAFVDSGTCVLMAFVAFQWMPSEERKHTAAIATLTLATVCPFTAIYIATILTEVPTSFLAVAMVLAATVALKSANGRRALTLWAVAGLIAGIAVLFRPDSGLFAAAIGTTIVISAIACGKDALDNKVEGRIRQVLRSVPPAAMFSLAFCLVLVPWTIRNRRVFHLFQPLAPAHGEMPGEFVPRGYLLWLRTWLDDGRYIGPVLWSLDTSPLKIDTFPDKAFDSEQERDRVAVLLEKYNHPPEQPEPDSQPDSQPQTRAEISPQTGTPSPSPTEEPSPEEGETQQEDEEAPEDEQQAGGEESNVEMTPAVDAEFGQLARERIARAPVRYYFVLPIKRAGSLWFDTHSQYYPFEGELLPLQDLDHQIHQQMWLPLFAALTWLYSLLGVAGGWLLWRCRDFSARRWVILAGAVILMRLGFFATLENPEPRYTVELFPFLAILGGIAVGQILGLMKARKLRSAPE